MVKMGKD